MDIYQQPREPCKMNLEMIRTCKRNVKVESSVVCVMLGAHAGLLGGCRVAGESYLPSLKVHTNTIYCIISHS